MHPQRNVILSCSDILLEQPFNAFERQRVNAIQNYRNQSSYGRMRGGAAQMGAGLFTGDFGDMLSGMGRIATGAGNAIADLTYRPTAAQQVRDERGNYIASGQAEQDTRARIHANSMARHQQFMDDLKLKRQMFDDRQELRKKELARRTAEHQRDREFRDNLNNRRLDAAARDLGVSRDELGARTTTQALNTGQQQAASTDWAKGASTGLDADLARATQPLNRQLGVGEIGNETGTYVRGTPAERRRLAGQAGIGVNSSTSVIEREAASRRLQNRELGGASLMPGGVPRDKQGNEVANTIANREAEMRSRTIKPGESNRTTSTGQRLVSNERDLSGRMYKDTGKEAARVRREDERRAAENKAKSVDTQATNFQNASSEERAEMIRRANASVGYSTPRR